MSKHPAPLKQPLSARTGARKRHRGDDTHTLPRCAAGCKNYSIRQMRTPLTPFSVIDRTVIFPLEYRAR